MKQSSRRRFFQTSFLGGSSLLLLPQKGVSVAKMPTPEPPENPAENPLLVPSYPIPPQQLLNLAPASWIWLPSQRTLANTILLFRKSLILKQLPSKATGWILGDSRYKLYLNGQRQQFGPAPADPRHAEADPINLTQALKLGNNILGAEVLYYGHGDGTWPIGKPGFIFYLELQYANGQTERVVSDTSWQVKIADSWPPGQYKRWYLRAFQEEFDARLYPYGWHSANYQPNATWLPAMILQGRADKPAIASNARDYLYDSSGNEQESELRKRFIPFMKEELIRAKQLSEQHWLHWKIAPESYFQFVTPPQISFDVERINFVKQSESRYIIDFSENPSPNKAAALNFEFTEQHVGWPLFSITAAEGTIVEILVHEAHTIGGDALMNTHFHSWSRFICKEGRNDFETFDFESFRWLQLHIRNTKGVVVVENVGMRWRQFPFKNSAQFNTSDPKLQTLLRASVNTLLNSCQETVVDGMARERQQYSGDGGHQLHCLYQAFGESQLPARFCQTYSQGLTKDGFFLDSWPAYDRLARLMERQMGLTEWGPIIDHGIGFTFDTYFYYLYTGRTEEIREVFPKLLRFFEYLMRIRTTDGLLPVENLGIPYVWIDHHAYKQQRHKQCAFTLYAVAMMHNALVPLCEAFEQNDWAKKIKTEGQSLWNVTVEKYWDQGLQTFVVNKPWAKEEGEIRYCDRSIATALMYGLFPDNNYGTSLDILAKAPAQMGYSYPINQCWRYWALAQYGRSEVVLREFRERWFTMESVRLNNTITEDWDAKPDSNAQWSHCAVVPMFVTYMSLAGIKPSKAGFSEVEIRPQLGDLSVLSLTYYTVKGGIEVDFRQEKGKLSGSITLPEGIKATLYWQGKTQVLKAGKQEIG